MTMVRGGGRVQEGEREDGEGRRGRGFGREGGGEKRGSLYRQVEKMTVSSSERSKSHQ